MAVFGFAGVADNIELTISFVGDTGDGRFVQRYRRAGYVAIPDTASDHNKTYQGYMDYTVPAGSVCSEARIYFESQNSNGEKGSYRLKSLRILDLQADIAGYTRTSNGVYESNYSEYNIDFDTDTITNPLKLAESYTVDGSFSRTITLNSDNGWKYSWNNTTLNENNNNYLYQYYIAETKIGGITVNEPDSMGRILSADGNYLVSYDNDFVAANTENSPITVTNKYIWYKLPATGGIGTDGVCVAGVILAISGFIGRVALRKRERRYK